MYPIFMVLLAASFLFLGFIYFLSKLFQTPSIHTLEEAIDHQVKKFYQGKLFHEMTIGIYQQGKVHIKHYCSSTHKSPMKAPEPSSTHPSPSYDQELYQLGSITQLFTVTLLQIFIERNQLHIHDDLQHLIGQNKKLSDRVKTITLYQLATHTSGFTNIPSKLYTQALTKINAEFFQKNPYQYIDSSDVWQYLEDADDLKSSGRFEYSDFGIGLIGYIIEIIGEKPFNELVTKLIFEPLDMNSTSQCSPSESSTKLKQGYNEFGEEKPPFHFNALQASNSFSSNISDMLNFIKANIEDDIPLSAILKKNHQAQLNKHTGLGWILPSLMDKGMGNQGMVWHHGKTGGFTGYISVHPNNKFGVIILSNHAICLDLLGSLINRQSRKYLLSAS